MNDKIGIYLIKCIENNKIYIGSAKNLDRRKKQHFSNLSKNKHKNMTQKQIASLYGVTEGTVAHIIKNRTWIENNESN